MQLTYIKDDNLVIVDGRPIKSEYVAPSVYLGALHAVVWSDNLKEYQSVIDGVFTNTPLSDDGYDSHIKPLYDQWEAQRVIDDTPPPPEPELTLHEKALLVQMSKREFVKIVSYVTSQTAGMTPITLTLIETYVASQGDDLRNEWINCTYIERANPLLDEVAKDPMFGVSSELLDIMFANWQELLYLAENNLPLTL